MIEKNIHQIWVGSFALPKREAGFIDAVKSQYPDYTHYLWTDATRPTLPPRLESVYNKFYDIQNFAFCADILRLYVVHQYGGFYFDIDFEFNPSNRLDDFLSLDGIFFHHDDPNDLTIPNNVFGAKKGCEVLAHCLDHVSLNTTWYGPSWLGITVKSYFWLNNAVPHENVRDMLQKISREFYSYQTLESRYARHWSLYSWSPEVWNKMREGTYEG